MRRYDEALKDFDRTLSLAPNDAHAYGLRPWYGRRRAIATVPSSISTKPSDWLPRTPNYIAPIASACRRTDRAVLSKAATSIS
jgi:hypothetical protein